MLLRLLLRLQRLLRWLLPLLQTHFEHAYNHLMIHFTVSSLCNTTNQYTNFAVRWITVLMVESNFYRKFSLSRFFPPDIFSFLHVLLFRFKFHFGLWHIYTASDTFSHWHTHTYAHIHKILFVFDEHTFESGVIMISGEHDANFLSDFSSFLLLL